MRCEKLDLSILIALTIDKLGSARTDSAESGEKIRLKSEEKHLEGLLNRDNPQNELNRLITEYE